MRFAIGILRVVSGAIAVLCGWAVPALAHHVTGDIIVVADSNDDGTPLQSPEQQEEQQENQQGNPH